MTVTEAEKAGAVIADWFEGSDVVRAPDGTWVDPKDGCIVEAGHPQEGVSWSSCEGADPEWKP